MQPDAVVQQFDHWRRLGWMRPLEARFVAFLAELDPGADGRVLLAAGLVSHVLPRGHVFVDISSLVDEPARWLDVPVEGERGGRAAAADQGELVRVWRGLESELRAMDAAAWLDALSQSPLVSAGSGSSPLVLDAGRLYLRRNWVAGREVQTDLVARSRVLEQPLDPAALGALIDALFPHGEQQPGPDWQKIACAVALRHGFSIITGGPGTGKTWTMVKLLGLLQAVNQAANPSRPLRVMLAAPTGKAAARMTESVRNNWESLPEPFRIEAWRPEEARTLHRLLGARPDSRHFRHQRQNPVPADVVIVDEASMIDLQMMQALVRGLDPETRLVLLGDKDQLASVEPGAVFGDLCRVADRTGFDADLLGWLEAVTGESIPAASPGPLQPRGQRAVMLRQAHRFNQDIAALAAAVNAGQADRATDLLATRSPVLGWLQPKRVDDAELKRLLIDEGHARYLSTANQAAWLQTRDSEVLTRAAARPEALEAWAREALTAMGRFQVLTGTRSGRWSVEEINQRIRGWLAEAGWVEASGTWFHGRPVMINRNDYRTGLMNGDVGLCLRWPQPEGGSMLRVVFQNADGRLHHYATTRISDCQTAWAMTVHKAQGSEFTHSVLVLPEQPTRVLTRELIYTGLTRARERFTLVAPSEAVFRQALHSRTGPAAAISAA